MKIFLVKAIVILIFTNKKYAKIKITIPEWDRFWDQTIGTNQDPGWFADLDQMWDRFIPLILESL